MKRTVRIVNVHISFNMQPEINDGQCSMQPTVMGILTGRTHSLRFDSWNIFSTAQ